MKPDYSLYPKNNASIGFSSRGCFRKCYFCIVDQKEGKFRRTVHPEKWYNPAFKNITFLDNNILADKAWFLEITDWCISKDLKIWFTQGLDVRLVDIEIAKRLYEIRNHRMLSFAWDNIKDERVIKLTFRRCSLKSHNISRYRFIWKLLCLFSICFRNISQFSVMCL